MESNREKVIRELDKFHHRILNSSLAEKITEREITAIINAASLLAIEEQKIKEVVHKTIEAIKTKGNRNAYACMISGEFHESYTIQANDLEQIEKEILEEVE